MSWDGSEVLAMQFQQVSEVLVLMYQWVAVYCVGCPVQPLVDPPSQ